MSHRIWVTSVFLTFVISNRDQKVSNVITTIIVIVPRPALNYLFSIFINERKSSQIRPLYLLENVRENFSKFEMTASCTKCPSHWNRNQYQHYDVQRKYFWYWIYFPMWERRFFDLFYKDWNGHFDMNCSYNMPMWIKELLLRRLKKWNSRKKHQFKILLTWWTWTNKNDIQQNKNSPSSKNEPLPITIWLCYIFLNVLFLNEFIMIHFTIILLF